MTVFRGHAKALTAVNGIDCASIKVVNQWQVTDSNSALDAGSVIDSKNRMSKDGIPQTLLHRIDAARNMARFYCLSLQPTLFGEISVVREWGRIGTRGRMKIDSYTTREGADTAFARLEKSKRRRGYRG